MNTEIILEQQVSDESGSRQFVLKLAEYLKPGTTFLLYGDLGSGKTFLVREIAAILNVKSDVSSPSFALVHQYKPDIDINHIDLYRINDSSEISNLGLDEMLNSESLNFVEWPQLIEDKIHWKHYRIMIDTDSGNELYRKYTVQKLC